MAGRGAHGPAPTRSRPERRFRRAPAAASSATGAPTRLPPRSAANGRRRVSDAFAPGPAADTRQQHCTSAAWLPCSERRARSRATCRMALVPARVTGCFSPLSAGDHENAGGAAAGSQPGGR
eukprot:1646539-Prymnesium_polylepis.1